MIENHKPENTHLHEPDFLEEENPDEPENIELHETDFVEVEYPDEPDKSFMKKEVVRIAMVRSNRNRHKSKKKNAPLKEGYRVKELKYPRL